jgi:hypothetical protein
VFKAKANPLKSLAKPTKDLYNRNKCENYINIPHLVFLDSNSKDPFIEIV